MSVIGTLLVLLGTGIVLLGNIFFILAAFRTSILWGLAVLFLPPAGLFFLIVHWPRAQNPFYLMLWGWGFMFLGRLAFHASLPWPLG